MFLGELSDMIFLSLTISVLVEKISSPGGDLISRFSDQSSPKQKLVGCVLV